ncbi:2-polyprenyl-6-methoxyphenol hydroxylase-like FAD-dependent oxidoreductase [Chryseobacterium vietnamense]|uniref:FAD-dependent monooxygenase n=1 Tax=Chryseobacterium vietnamense TaxID=866785 RepID=UPI002862062D|nr:FAD-dependent monooxygenase [Chryseobacterium vietnamense]MDR6487240.1 2-polyprenyl-6-methoxyphenol hydroxylase-like FAD-dependent oxidoreductase [Chryseobacterium vietnamense]
MKKNILISGGGIAGLTAAKLLSEQGHNVTVIDRALSFTKAGFLISLKSFGVRIMEELDLMEQLQAASSPSEFVSFLEKDEQLIQHISYEKMNKNIERSVLISRGGLHNVLYDNLKDQVNILFNTTISGIASRGNKTEVIFSDGQSMEADLVIVSEGLRSSTRERYFTDSQMEDFNTLYMGGRLQMEHSYTVGDFKIYIDVNKMLSIYPIANNEIAIQSYIHHTGDIATIKQRSAELLESFFSDYNIEVRDLLTRFTEEGLIFVDKMGMVEASDLVNGNLVLLGDAGYCPTALSGMGASLSIYGAKALSHFIGKTPDDLASACSNYNTLMQPIIRKFQGNARNNASSFIPADAHQLNQFVNTFRAASDIELKKIMTDPIILTEDQLNFKIN